jgi:glyoxylase I family protein
LSERSFQLNNIGAQGFHHIAIAAQDFDRSVSFYRDGLGFPEVLAWDNQGNRAALFDAGQGCWVEIFERPGHALQEGQLLHYALKVSDCRAAHAAALAAGATEIRPPRDVDIPSDPAFPVTISFVAGPDGEEIELFHER